MTRRRRRIATAVVGLVVFAGMALLNALAFRAWLDTDYFRWYLENGAGISLLFGLVTLAWGDLDKHTYLISAHPDEYAAASMSLLLLPISSLGAMFAPGREQWRRSLRRRRAFAALSRQRQVLATNPEGTRELRRSATGILYEAPASATSDPEAEPTGIPRADLVCASLFTLAFCLALAAWLLVIAPLQYFVYLVTGAPAREIIASSTRSYFSREDGMLIYGTASKAEPIPEGALESGFSARPVTLTAAITAATLFAVSRLI